MPPARRFLSYIPRPPQEQQSHDCFITMNHPPMANDAGLFSTFAIYQGQNQLGRTRTQSATSIEECSNTSETIISASPSLPHEVPELDKTFMRLYNRFRNKYDLQFPDTPCAYCSLLLLPRNVIWQRCQPGYEYPLWKELQILPTTQMKNGREYIAICKACNINPCSLNNPGPWPQCLLDLPQRSRIFLSPLTLQTSLGRTQSSQQIYNPYTTYWTITGRMNVTRNLRVIALFSGMIGTFLESSQNSIYSGHDIQLLNTCCQWLLMHNPLFTHHDIRSELGMNPVHVPHK